MYNIAKDVGLQLNAEGFGGSDAPKQVQSLHLFIHLNAQQHYG
jgi:hypothetical protein